MILGHRGASAIEPENTVAAFVAALEAGADGVELDVRQAADGVLVLFHDSHLPDGRLVADHPSSELPGTTLDAALDVCGTAFVNVEIKHLPGEPDAEHALAVAEAVADTLVGRRLQATTLVSSFDLATVDRVRQLAPELATGCLYLDHGALEAVVDHAVRMGHGSIHPPDACVDQALVDLAHHAGLAVHTWTVDDPERIRALVDMGVDGIITNHPRRALAALDSTGGPDRANDADPR